MKGKIDPANEPAPANAAHELIGAKAHPIELIADLQPARALPGDDIWVVEAGDDRRAFALGDIGTDHLAVFKLSVIADHIRTARTHALGLNRGSVMRHDDPRRDRQEPGGFGDPLCVIAGRKRDYAALALRVGKLEKCIEGASKLERSGALERLQFQVDGRAGHRREGVGVLEGSVPGGLGHPVAGVEDGLEVAFLEPDPQGTIPGLVPVAKSFQGVAHGRRPRLGSADAEDLLPSVGPCVIHRRPRLPEAVRFVRLDSRWPERALPRTPRSCVPG